jgi:hypothetical protein
MWEHRNKICLAPLSPANLGAIAYTNDQNTAEFDQGTDGLGHGNYHWLDKPLAHVLGYDKAHKAQWLASIDLARKRFIS